MFLVSYKTPGLEEYSIHHAKLYSKINPLVVDRFTSNELFTGCYVLLDGGKILATRFDVQVGMAIGQKNL